MFPLALIGGVLLLAFSMGGKSKGQGLLSTPASSGPALDPAVVQRMNAAILSKDGEALVSALGELLASGKAEHPQVAQAITMVKGMITSLQPVREVTAGRAGRKWKLQVISAFDDGTVVRDVFTPSGTRVLRFIEKLNVPGTRKLIRPAEGADPALISSAMTDFNLAEDTRS